MLLNLFRKLAHYQSRKRFEALWEFKYPNQHLNRWLKNPQKIQKMVNNLEAQTASVNVRPRSSLRKNSSKPFAIISFQLETNIPSFAVHQRTFYVNQVVVPILTVKFDLLHARSRRSNVETIKCTTTNLRNPNGGKFLRHGKTFLRIHRFQFKIWIFLVELGHKTDELIKIFDLMCDDLE